MFMHIYHRLQFMTCGLSQTSVPTSIHCDHLIQAVNGAESDLKAGPAHQVYGPFFIVHVV